MAPRSYRQYCSVAQALDQIGDRWTLLLVRELMIGPRRFSDLADGLVGIGANHLSERLRRLLDAGVIRRRALPPPAAARVYELTERGRELEPVIVALARWGNGLLGKPDAQLAWRPDWTVVALRGRFDEAAADGVDETYQFDVDGKPFWARVHERRLETGLGRAANAAVTVTADHDTFLGVASGTMTLEQAIETERYRVDGDMDALRRAATIFPLPAPSPGDSA